MATHSTRRSSFNFALLTALALVGIQIPASAVEPKPTPSAVAFDTPSAPPPGYKSNVEVMAAIGLKQVKLIDPVKEIPAGVVETKDIEYGKVGERSLKLDLYQPAEIRKPVPGLIFIHGGAWSGGSRDMYRYYTVRYAQRGYVAATISYRLSGEAPFPAAVQDAKCAVRWLRANAAKYHVDPDKIAAIGGSAGGHLSMMIGYAPDVPELEGHGGHAGVSSRVAAVVNIYGPYDLTTEIGRKSGSVKKFLGGKTYEEAPDLYLAVSPSKYLKKGAPPTLILHGTIDDVVPIEQSDMLAKKLAGLGVPYVYDRLEGWPHAMDLAESVNERCQWFMNQFFAKYLPLPKP